jgi:uncharacterized membrane protein YhiD involved in acid resistance
MGRSMNAVTIKDFFTHGSRDVSSLEVLISTLIAAVLLFIILMVYRRYYKGILYSASFGASLVMVGLITTFVILTIKSNLILSLGLVGALSIVRFRTAVKDAIDIAYMFWAISIGLACGAGMYFIAIGSTIVLTLAAILLKGIPSLNEPYLLTIVTEQNSNIMETIEQFGKLKIRSKSSVEDGKISTTLELFTNEKSLEKVQSAFIENDIAFSLVRNESNYST